MFEWRFGYTRRQSVYGAFAQLRAVMTHRVTVAQLQQINKDIPAISIFTGDQDNLVNPGNSIHLAQHMPRAQYTKIHGAGHALPAQVPDELNPALGRTVDLAMERLASDKTWA